MQCNTSTYTHNTRTLHQTRYQLSGRTFFSDEDNTTPPTRTQQQKLPPCKLVRLTCTTKQWNSIVDQVATDEIIINPADRRPLNPEQLLAYHIVAKRMRLEAMKPGEKCGKPLRLYVGGAAGTGKSRLITAIQTLANKAGVEVWTGAYTGLAASLVEGSTITKALELMRKTQTEAVRQAILKRFRGIRYIDIDEISMVSAMQLYQISNQLNWAFRKDGEEFAGINMIFMGDFFQMAPIGGMSLTGSR